jgi:hypothetical protein
MLLNAGAAIDLRGGEFAREQFRAAMASNGVVVRLQLEARAQEGGADGRHLNAVISAALAIWHGDVKLVRMLLRAWAARPLRVESRTMLDNWQTHEGEDCDEQEKTDDEKGKGSDKDVAKPRRYSA